jgi:DNA-binding MarR family transcriptional regulator
MFIISIDITNIDIIINHWNDYKLLEIIILKMKNNFYSQYLTLKEIDNNKNIILRQLSKKLGIYPDNTTDRIHFLESKGLIKRVIPKTNKRIKQIILTPKGKRLLSYLGKVMELNS